MELLNDQPSQTALQPVSDASVVITALLGDMHPLSQNQNGSRKSSLEVIEAGDCCSSSLQWNQGVEYGPVRSLCPLLLDIEINQSSRYGRVLIPCN